ncbi:phosphatidylglycerophosphatase A [Budviciaceae bacterium CWB-B4]|uniref:Phosphatidylglycerophosphatase A n=1 Tax=Limnobaculum xujianqingii TaxID=2738837 RepID=A0A9D7FW09_9GAMM|nr:phosphatidylglycerophosphatase A [Limnobaculum xujianqingii]MBK5071822.1 phosphatidylglycerophosphatase A [Limnobaculum xujianqingii]MBK5175131.1 phosphatidylglycerophosphatase A [Limnobaculum xujianqingii]
MSIKIKPELYKLSISNPLHWLATGFGSGLSPKAPGTFGSLAAIPFFYLLQMLPMPAYLVMLVLTFALGVWACQSATDAIGMDDHGAIVWDEFVGMWITCIALPQGFIWMVAAFVTFRFFDILKPWPIRWFDNHCTGGFGIMIDDVIAGLIAFGVIQAAYWLV